jgi:exosortase K
MHQRRGVKEMNKSDQIPMQKIFYSLLVVFIAVGLKYAYSQSTSEDLVWILGPTASLVEFITGMQFAKEVNIGYICTGRQVAIVPACAGINFMIAAFCMTALTLIYKTKQKGFIPFCLLAGFAAAYGFTLCVNSFRITLSIYLYHADIYTPSITPEGVHRIEGIVIYFTGLCLLYFGVLRITNRHDIFLIHREKDEGGSFRSNLLSCLVPLFWYWLIALALPVLNRASRENPSLFWEHARSVFAVSFSIFMMMFMILMCYSFVKSKHETRAGSAYETKDSDRR